MVLWDDDADDHSDLDDVGLDEDDLCSLEAACRPGEEFCSDEDDDESLLQSVREQVGSFQLKEKEKESVERSSRTGNGAAGQDSAAAAPESLKAAAEAPQNAAENRKSPAGRGVPTVPTTVSTSADAPNEPEVVSDSEETNGDIESGDGVDAEQDSRALLSGFSSFLFDGEDCSDLVEAPCSSDGGTQQETPFMDNVQVLRLAIEKNRACKGELEALLDRVRQRMSWNAELQKRTKTLIGLEKFCKRRVCARPNYEMTKLVASLIHPSSKRRHSVPGPEKNQDVDGFLMLQTRSTLVSKEWSAKETEDLMEAVRMQVQQHLFLQAMRDAVDDDDGINFAERKEKISSITTEEVGEYLDVVDWDKVATSSAPAKTAEDCEARWRQGDKPFNSTPWTKQEDKKLLSLAQEFELRNWTSIAERLGTRRTAAQCLTRYQRSLNGNILRREWTTEEDEQLKMAVDACGEKDWEAVAACLQGRTGPQARNRWKSVQPCGDKKKVGRWSIEEDKRLKWAVAILGAPQWKKIAVHVPGRTDSQCRERWCNVLDPGLNHGSWSSDEDERLNEAVEKHGQHHWSAVAEMMKPRTDNQCKRRWIALHPEVKDEFHKEAQIKRTCVPKFGKRKKECPDLELTDFAQANPGLITENQQSAAKKKKPDSVKCIEAGGAEEQPKGRAKKAAAGTRGRKRKAASGDDPAAAGPDGGEAAASQVKFIEAGEAEEQPEGRAKKAPAGTRGRKRKAASGDDPPDGGEAAASQVKFIEAGGAEEQPKKAPAGTRGRKRKAVSGDDPPDGGEAAASQVEAGGAEEQPKGRAKKAPAGTRGRKRKAASGDDPGAPGPDGGEAAASQNGRKRKKPGANAAEDPPAEALALVAITGEEVEEAEVTAAGASANSNSNNSKTAAIAKRGKKTEASKPRSDKVRPARTTRGAALAAVEAQAS